MQIDIQSKDDLLIAVLNGEVDHHYAEHIRNKIECEYNSVNAKNIIISFKNVRFMDSSGIGVVIGRYKLATARGGTLVACDLTLEAKRIFDISGLAKIIKVYDNLDDAINSFNNNV